jgi:hypothetical protein
MLEYRTRRCFVQTGAAVGPGLEALVYAGLYAVLPEAIAWRALFAAPTSLSPRPAANDAVPAEFSAERMSDRMTRREFLPLLRWRR